MILSKKAISLKYQKKQKHLKNINMQKFNPINKSQFTQGYFEEIKKNDQLFTDFKGLKYPVLGRESYKRNQQYFIKIILK